MPATKPTRVDADLFEAAAAEGALQSRSAAQQINHWARMGRTIAVHGSAGKERIVQALAGTLPLHQLDEGEQLVVNAELDADINARAAATQFGPVLARGGITTVALDEHGVLTRYHPDGTTSPLE